MADTTMDDTTFDRRRVLRRAGVAAGGALAVGLAMPTTAHAESESGGPAEGSWLATRTDPAAAVTQFVISFARGGVCTAFDIAPAILNGGGAWSARGTQLSAVIWYGIDGTDESPPVTLRVTAEAVVDGDELVGTFFFEVFFNGQQVDRVEGGTWVATRITT